MGRKHQASTRGGHKSYRSGPDTGGNHYNRKSNGNEAYIEGNTVRRLEAAPRQDPRRERQEKQEKERKRRARQAAWANQERAQQMSRGYVVFLSLAVFVTVGVCVLFLKMQSELHRHIKEVASLESQILELKTDNDTALKKIDSSIDLDMVRDTAMNQMGMVYPGKDQIVYFRVEPEDYMNQYQDIPRR